VKDGKPAYTYNFLGLEQFTVAAKNAIPSGSVSIGLDFAYEGGKEELGKGGMATLTVNGSEVAKGRIKKTQPLLFSADVTADVGLDNQTPVVDGIGIGPEETRFTGKIDNVVISVKHVQLGLNQVRRSRCRRQRLIQWWSAYHVSFLMRQHVPEDRCDSAHDCHTSDLRSPAQFDPPIPLSHSRILFEEVQNQLSQ
jgi:hypothetical protein